MDNFHTDNPRSELDSEQLLGLESTVVGKEEKKEMFNSLQECNEKIQEVLTTLKNVSNKLSETTSLKVIEQLFDDLSELLLTHFGFEIKIYAKFATLSTDPLLWTSKRFAEHLEEHNALNRDVSAKIKAFKREGEAAFNLPEISSLIKNLVMLVEKCLKDHE